MGRIGYKEFALFILIVLHSVGLFQITVLGRSELMEVSHIIILISFGLCLIPELQKKGKSKLMPFFLAFSVGILAEGIGVNTGILFGDYAYGDALGLKVFGVPIIIGFLWLSLSIGIISMLKSIQLKPVWIILFGSLIMTLFDVLLEPIAIHYNYWTWEGGNIPIFNYVCWFLTSLIIFGILINQVEKKSLFKVYFIINLLFFLGLTFSI